MAEQGEEHGQAYADHISMLQEAIASDGPFRASVFGEPFTGLNGIAAQPAGAAGPSSAALPVPTTDEYPISLPWSEEDDPLRTEEDYDRMIQDMTARAWKRAWTTYTAKSAAAKQAAQDVEQQLQQPQHPPPQQTPWLPHPTHAARQGGAQASSRVANVKRGDDIFDARSRSLNLSVPTPPTLLEPPEARSFTPSNKAALHRRAQEMASASLRASSHDAALRSPSGLQLSSSLGAARGRHSARPSSYLQAHLVKSSHKAIDSEPL